jgi:biopolymer transport protein TolR
MAMAVGSPGRRGRRRRSVPISGINVTPMVDVMLVLLVIFMVTAPLLTAGVPVDLPATNASPLKGDDQPLTVSIKSDGSVWLQETAIELDQLTARLQAISSAKPDTRIFVRGDAAANYGRIMEVMGTLSSAGFSHVALVTQSPKPAAQGSGKSRQK